MMRAAALLWTLVAAAAKEFPIFLRFQKTASTFFLAKQRNSWKGRSTPCPEVRELVETHRILDVYRNAVLFTSRLPDRSQQVAARSCPPGANVSLYTVLRRPVDRFLSEFFWGAHNACERPRTEAGSEAARVVHSAIAKLLGGGTLLANETETIVASCKGRALHAYLHTLGGLGGFGWL